MNKRICFPLVAAMALAATAAQANTVGMDDYAEPAWIDDMGGQDEAPDYNDGMPDDRMKDDRPDVVDGKPDFMDDKYARGDDYGKDDRGGYDKGDRDYGDKDGRKPDEGGQETPPIPVPAAAWLFGSGLIGLIGIARRRAKGGV